MEPTGTCWCGCGKETAPNSYFLQGHDKAAVAAVVELEYGSAMGFLLAHGFGPGGKNLHSLLERKRATALKRRKADLEKWRRVKIGKHDDK